MIKCICGKEDFTRIFTEHYVLSPEGKNAKISLSDIIYGKCDHCGIVRQTNPRFYDDTSYKEFYEKEYPPVHHEYVGKNWDHDLSVAHKRIAAYREIDPRILSYSSKLLDIGSGSGAFVYACRGINVEAYGCEIGKYAYSRMTDHTYRQRFEDIKFPNYLFDTITSHDVLEHVLNPLHMIQEVKRVLSPGGFFIVDYPDFWCMDGKHHWKDNEHIWMFNDKQLLQFLDDSGFYIFALKKPIPSKLVFFCKKK